MCDDDHDKDLRRNDDGGYYHPGRPWPTSAEACVCIVFFTVAILSLGFIVYNICK